MKVAHINTVADEEYLQIDITSFFNIGQSEHFMGFFEVVDEEEVGAAATLPNSVVRYSQPDEPLTLLFVASESGKCSLLPWIDAPGKRRQMTEAELGRVLENVDGWLVSGIVAVSKTCDVATLWFGVVRKSRWTKAGKPSVLMTSDAA